MKLPKGWIFIAKPIRKGTAIEIEQRDLILCGECKWSYTDERDGTLWCKVHMSHYRVIADHFCKYGERRSE